ncbi:MAG: amino acid adenylation domain-containing protein, partial [Gammaproteobacteria bacterium]|nr:amino acid adenylation domain-containing protein [Gammaproteobacteria bacterium]
VTPFMVLFTAFVVLLHRHSGQNDLALGSPVANRNRSEIEGLVGCFVNSLVLRTDLSGDPTFRELLARVREVALDAYAHQDLPFDALVQVMEPKRDLSRNPLFQVMFALQADGSRSIEGEELRLSVVAIEVETTRFDLECYLIPDAGKLRVQMVYSTDMFDASSIDRMLTHFEHLLDRSITAPQLPVSRIDLLGVSERQWLLENATGRVCPIASEEMLLARFSSVVRRDPQAPALHFGNHSLTYGELDSASNRMAERLCTLGARVDEPVAVLLERSLEMVVAWLAVLKSGAAYLPMDPENPAARLQQMLKDSAAAVLISDSSLAQRVTTFHGNLLCVDEVAALHENQCDFVPAIEPGAESMAYLIYTSGSTGLPKGVAVTHSALANLVAWHNRAYSVTTGDRATQIAGLGFDATLWEIWPYLCTGASVYLVDEETRHSPRLLWQWLAENRITLSFVPTPMAEAMLREPIPEAIALRAMLTGGDRLHGGGLPQQLPFRLINHYGPTENAVVSTFGEVDLPRAAQKAPTIGRPIDNVNAYVLDTRMQPVPIGVTGELYLGGESLARGYWRNQVLTDERFVTSPFADDADTRLYRSGDLVRWRADGQLEFVGRKDQQVKIRGYRIELGEIEVLLNGCPGIGQAVVTCHGEEESSKRLIAYLVRSSSTLNLSEVRDQLRDRLPGYMLPAVWIELDSLPLTRNGKVDRTALPAPTEQSSAETPSHVAPRNQIERQVAAIWCELLGLERVSVDDNFFDLGGHSLVASQVVSRIRDELQVDMLLSRFFKRPTVAGLAEQIQVAALSNTTDNGSENDTHEEFRL